jgi:hypothetical protein
MAAFSCCAGLFYHRDVVGHHRRADGSTQDLGYDDVANRLDWDKQTSAGAVCDVRDIVAEEDRFALRFVYTADFVPTGGKIDVEVCTSTTSGTARWPSSGR